MPAANGDPGTPPAFWPNSHAFGGFLIAARDNERLRSVMCAAGAVRRQIGSHAAYLWNFPPGERLFSGIGVLDGVFHRGPVALAEFPPSMIGYCAGLDLGDEITVRTDEFGMYPVYYSDEIITDRLHLAMMASPAIDGSALLAMFHDDWMFGQQLNTRRMPVEGFRMLGVGERLRLSDRVRVECHRLPCEQLAPDEYRELIRKGADEIRSNLSAALDAHEHVTFAITGGRDSRINLAALVSLGRVDEVRFRTRDIEDDLPIGSGLVRWAGGRYCKHPLSENWLGIDDAYERRRSVNFGTYHPLEAQGLRLCYRSDTDILIAGGMGEAFRSMYVAQGFGDKSADEPYTYELIQTILRDLCAGERFFDGLFESISPALGETFERLRGSTIARRLDDHYLNFRNRIHFRGLHQSSATGCFDFHPLMAPSLLRAARGLPYPVKATGRVIYDVTRELCPDLARFRYGTAWPLDMTDSEFFDPTPGPTDLLALEPAPELASTPSGAEPPGRQPPGDDEEMTLFVEQRLRANLEALWSGMFPEVTRKPFRDYLDWARERRPQRWRCLASKVQTLVDYGLVSQEYR